MKKQLNIILVLFLVFALSGCFGKTTTNDDIEDAKQQLLNNSGGTSSGNNQDVPKYEDTGLDNNTGSTNTNTGNIVKDDNSNVATEKYTVNYLGDENFLEINDLSKQDFSGRKVEITGKTLVNVDKIIVNFSNSSSSFPDDKYQLSQFNAGDKTFLYRAFSQYQTLDYGTNEYIIEAYSGDDVSRVELIINIPRPGETSSTNTNKEENNSNIVQNSTSNEDNNTSNTPSLTSLNLSDLPTNTDYGNPENLGEGKVGYSRIKGLQMEMIEPSISLSTSDEVNSFLIDHLNGWFFWNSLRSGDTLTSVYVIRLDGDKYVYEKHYYISNGMHGVLQLETGTGVDKENINDANIELRDKNGEFDTVAADKLFNDLSK